MAPPLISVIIPVYGPAEHLDASLASLEAQTYRPLEIIIVDDGNEQFSSPAAHDGLPVTVLHEPHRGAAAARNAGFKAAKGTYILFWDADVVGKPGMIENLFRGLAGHPEAAYAYSDYFFGSKRMPSGPFDPSRLLDTNYISMMSLMRRDVFPGFDESLRRFQDWDLWLTLLERRCVGVYVPQCLFRVLPAKGTISTWLPSLAYRAPWKYLPWVREKVADYEEAKAIVKRKHRV